MKCHQMGLIHPEDEREMSYKLVTEMLAKAPSKEFAFTDKKRVAKLWF